MIEEAQKILEKLFSSGIVSGHPFYNKKTGRWHIKFADGLIIRTKDLLEVQTLIEIYTGEDDDL